LEPTDRSKYDPRIDVLRAFACGMVAVVHFSVPTWTDPIVERGFILDTVALSIIKTGWLGVPFFLFISGFSLALNKTHRAYELDKKQFFINRVLRIFPVWIVCLLILSFTQRLSGANVFTLLFLQMQDLPSATNFSLAWSIQLEFTCYLIFPILLAAAATRKNILPFFAFFLLVRIWLYYLPVATTWLLSYNTAFGEGTVFLSGILASSLPPLTNKATARTCLTAGIVLFCAVAVFIAESGGYQAPHGRGIHLFFLLMPEVLAATFFLIVRGTITRIKHVPGAFGVAAIPGFHRALSSVRGALFTVFSHFGRVSYSAYMFSLFTLDFTARVFTFVKPSGWLAMLAGWALYFPVLTLFSTVSFYAIELPFLRMRRVYVHGARDRAADDSGTLEPSAASKSVHGANALDAKRQKHSPASGERRG
jgi:peptidoglycan/LPS O-acetylase OafA/YrhL